MNLGTFIVLIILIALVSLIIYSMRKDRKAGKNSCGASCGGACSGCGHSTACEKITELADNLGKKK